MNREVYYESDSVIDLKEYKSMMNLIRKTPENRLSKTSHIRKIYFNNDINYLEKDTKDKDVYSIVIVDGDREHMMVELKSCRSGMILKDYAPIKEVECRNIFRGNIQWLQDSPYPLLKKLYLEIKINRRRIGVVVDYERQRFRLNHRKDFIEFDLSVKSVYGQYGDLLSDKLLMKERLDAGQVILAYKQSVYLPPVFTSVVKLTPPVEETVKQA